MFTRVPKTGSLAVNSMLEHLREMNNYSVFSSIDGMPKRNEDTEYTYESDTNLRYDTLSYFVKNEPVKSAAYLSMYISKKLEFRLA